MPQREEPILPSQQVPGVRTNADGDTVTLPDRAPSSGAPLSDERAKGLALRAAVGLPASTKDSETLRNDFVVGWGDFARLSLAEEKKAKSVQGIQESFSRTLSAVASGQGTKLDQLALESMSHQAATNAVPEVDPDVVIETAWGEELVNGHNIKSGQEAIDDDPLWGTLQLNASERIYQARAINADVTAELMEQWGKKSFGAKATHVGSLFIPWYSNGVLAYNAKDPSLDPGGTLENEFDYWTARAIDPEVPLGQYKEELREHLNGMFKASPLDAMELGRLLNEYNSADRAMYTAMGVGDLLGSLAGGFLGKTLLAIGVGASAAAKRGPSSLMKLALKNRGAPDGIAENAKASADLARASSGVVPDLDAVKAAGGAAEDVAVTKGIEKVLKDFNLKEAARDFKSDLEIADEIPSLFNLPKLTGKKLTPELTEMVRKTNESIYRRKAMLLEGINSQLRMPRVDANQIKKGLESMADDINRDYANVQEAVLGVRDVPLTVDDKVNVVRLEAVVGTKKGGFFASERSAKAALKQTFDEGKNSEFDFKVEQYGDKQFYISVMRDMDESNVDIRNMEIPTKNATQRSRFSYLLDPRGSKNILSGENYDQGLIASYGISGNLQARLAVAQRTIKKAKSSEKKEIGRFMDMQSNSMNPRGGNGKDPGWWSHATDDFVLDFREFSGRYPTQGEMDLYYTYKDVHEFEHVLRNLNTLTAKRAQGRRMYKLRIPTEDGGHQLTPGIEGKLIRDVNEIPWKAKHSTRVAFINEETGASTLVRSKGKADQFMNENLGEWKFIQLGRDGRVTLLEDTPVGANLQGKHVDYIAVRDFESEGLPYNQVPYRDGPPRSQDRGHYTSQPDLEIVQDSTGKVVRVFYKGDVNLMQHATTKEAGKFGERFNAARRLYRTAKGLPEGKQKAKLMKDLDSLVQDEFPWWGTNEFIAQMEKKFNPDIPVMTRVHNTSLNNAKQVEKWVKKKYGEDVEFNDGVDNPFDLDNAIDYRRSQKREPLGHRVSVAGDQDNPVFSLEKPLYVDPATTISRQIHEAVKGRYFDDLKMQYSSQFIREFGDVIDATPDQMKMDPVGTLLTAKVNEKGADLEKIKAAKVFQRTAQNFVGVNNRAQLASERMIDAIAARAYDVLGVKGLDMVHNSKALGMLTDAPTLLRSMAFHTSMGFFNPAQLFVQSQTHANITALEGVDAASRGVSAAWVQGALFKNWQKGMPEKVARHTANAMGWKEEHFLEAWEGLKRSGFWNVGTEVVQRDSLSPTLHKSGFLDSGLFFFTKAEAFTRRAAYNAAYYKWRQANPNAVFDNAAQLKVLHRADFTTNTMGRNAKAAWNNGWMSVPTQFWNWNARMIDNFLGKEMTNSERARLLMVHSLMYGIPVGSGVAVVGQVIPFNEILRDQLMKNQIDYDENILSKLAMDGLFSTVLEGATGTKWNVGERYGTGALPIIEATYNLWRGNESFYEWVVEAMGGASHTTMANYLKAWDPAGAMLYHAFDVQDPSHLARTWDEFQNMMSLVGSSFNGLRQADMARRFGEYTTRNGNPVESSLADSIVKFITGLSPQQLSDDYRAQGLLRELSGHQKKVVDEASKLYQQGMREHRLGNSAVADSYFTSAKSLVKFGAPDDRTAAEWYNQVKNRTTRDRRDTYEALSKRGYHELERNALDGQ